MQFKFGNQWVKLLWQEQHDACEQQKKEKLETLGEKIKTVDVVKKRKRSCGEIAEQFKIGKTQVANVVKNEARLKVKYGNFQEKNFKHLRGENNQKYKAVNTIF